jgi:predicted ATPase
MAVKSLLKPVPGVDLVNQFELIQDWYTKICAPHVLKEAVTDELGAPDLLFSDGTYEYRYDGLSSGEQMLLAFLIRLVSDNIHESILLVDELELHLHPIWQRKILHALPRIGKRNQLIATTHSPYLREVLPTEAVIELGELLEPSPVTRV